MENDKVRTLSGRALEDLEKAVEGLVEEGIAVDISSVETLIG